MGAGRDFRQGNRSTAAAAGLLAGLIACSVAGWGRLAEAQGRAFAPMAPGQDHPAPAPAEPSLKNRPAPQADPLAGQIRLDVVVTGRQDTPVAELGAADFRVMDDKKEQKILQFQATAGDSGPVELMLLLDLVNSSFDQASEARAQMEKYLQANGGKLTYPTSILVLAQDGLRIQPRPSMDGNALASLLRQASPSTQTKGLGEIGRFQLSVRTLASIAENEVKSPSRKILVWTGPGWPMMAGANYSSSAQDRQRAFDTIVELCNRLREARIAIDSLTPIGNGKGSIPDAAAAPAIVHSMPTVAPEMAQQGRPEPAMDSAPEAPNYKEFLKAVKSARQVETANLALQVLAIQSGGRVLDPSNDLAAQIASCARDLSAFYTLTFRPDPPLKKGAYRELTVRVARPGLTARTYAGYYTQP